MTHRVQPDGYCETCRTVPCQATGGTKQLDRIEAKLNKVLRHLGLEDET